VTQALYRRYRPDTFAEVIGQEHVTEPLLQALRADKVTHAYLFSGPRGCGKTTSARILARCLNCAQGPTPVPCGTCDSCVELARGGSGSLDVVEIDAASHNGVDDARDLRERAAFAPARDRFKIFILDEAHMVTPQGFNALLKIVEEPPPHVKFIFATTEPDKVIGTIRSRTHHYPFRLVAPDTLQPYLEQLCVAEGVAVGAGVLPLVVRAGGGSVRDSLSVLDQLVAGAGAGGIDYERAVALLGYTHAALLDDTVDALAARDGASAFRVVDRVVSSGHEPRRFVEDVLERLRDLIVIAASGDAAQAVLRDLPADQLERMRVQASVLGASELSRSADLVNAALSEMTGATSPRLHLELLVARLLLPAVDDGVQGVGARLDRVERELGRVGSGQGAGVGAGPAPGAPVVPMPGTAGGAAAPEPATVQATVVPQAPAPATGAAPATPPIGTSSPATPRAASTPPSVASTPPSAASTPRAATPPTATPPSATPRSATPPSASRSAPAHDAPPSRPAATAVEAEMVRRRWPEVLATLRGLRMATWVLVSQNAQVAAASPDAVTLSFTTPQLATAFRVGPHADNVRTALHETLGLDVRVQTELAEPAADAPPARAGQRPSGAVPTAGAAVAAVGDAHVGDAPAVAPPGAITTAQAEASWGAPASGPSVEASHRDPAPRGGAQRSSSPARPSSSTRPSAPDAPATAATATAATAGMPGSPAPSRPESPAASAAPPAAPAAPPSSSSPPRPAGPAPTVLPSDGIPDGDEPDFDAPPEVAGARSASRPLPAAAPAPQPAPPAASRASSFSPRPTDSPQPAPPAASRASSFSPRPTPASQPARGQARPGGPPRRPAPGSTEEAADASPDDPDLLSTGLVGAPLIAQMLGGTVIDEIPDPPA